MRAQLCLIVALLSWSCTNPSGSDEGSRLTERVSSALGEEDLDQLGSLIADDAVIMAGDPVGLVLRGKEQILGFYRANLKELDLALLFSQQQFEHIGDDAVQQGSIQGSVTRSSDSVQTPSDGQFLHVLRKTSSGSWALWRGIWTFGHTGTMQADDCRSCCCTSITACDCISRPSTGCPADRPIPIVKP